MTIRIRMIDRVANEPVDFKELKIGNRIKLIQPEGTFHGTGSSSDSGEGTDTREGMIDAKITKFSLDPDDLFIETDDYVMHNSHTVNSFGPKEVYKINNALYADLRRDKSASLTARLDRIASELEKIDPRIALAIDQVSDKLAGSKGLEQTFGEVKALHSLELNKKLFTFRVSVTDLMKTVMTAPDENNVQEMDKLSKKVDSWNKDIQDYLK